MLINYFLHLQLPLPQYVCSYNIWLFPVCQESPFIYSKIGNTIITSFETKFTSRKWNISVTNDIRWYSKCLPQCALVFLEKFWVLKYCEMNWILPIMIGLFVNIMYMYQSCRIDFLTIFLLVEYINVLANVC